MTIPRQMGFWHGPCFYAPVRDADDTRRRGRVTRATAASSSPGTGPPPVASVTRFRADVTLPRSTAKHGTDTFLQPVPPLSYLGPSPPPARASLFPFASSHCLRRDQQFLQLRRPLVRLRPLGNRIADLRDLRLRESPQLHSGPKD